MIEGRNAGMPYHAGELAVQERAGTRERAGIAGRKGIRDHMPDQHRAFFAHLPFIVAASLDDECQPWASLIAGPPGFIATPTPGQMAIRATLATDDPLTALLGVGQAVGLLGIEAHTRRRNRMNGVVIAATESGLAIDVRQSFGNCPKYIQAREARFVDLPQPPGPSRSGNGLDADARRLIAMADTCFIATAHPAATTAGRAEHGVDVSHRGGRPGFVRVGGEGRLTMPDFAGNGFFNTLGNLQLLPRAGLLFVDFANGDLLQVAADAELRWDARDVGAEPGAERLLRFTPRRMFYREKVLPLQWSPPIPSPFLP